MTNGRDWWAGTHKNQVGPCGSREEAARRYFAAHPLRTYAVLTGYGAFGAHFDIRWLTFKDAEQRLESEDSNPLTLDDVAALINALPPEARGSDDQG